MNKKNTIKPYTLLRSKSKKYTPNHNHLSKSVNQPQSQQDKPKIFKQELEKSDVIEGFARIIYDYIQRYDQLLKSRYHGNHYPGPRLFNSPVISESPCLMQVQAFIQSIFEKRYMLHVESAIVALILLNRTNIKIHSQNWMRMILISLLLANKHCEDVYSVFNAKYVGLIPNLENLEINILELEFLKFLKYRLHIESETYNHYYAKLQEFFPIEEEQDLVDDSEVMISEEEQSVPNEEELVQSMSSEIEHDESREFSMSYGYGQMSNSCSNSWQDYNFDLVNNSIA
jgi:hypothetical protein